MEANPSDLPTLEELAADPELVDVFQAAAAPADTKPNAPPMSARQAPGPIGGTTPYVVVSADGMMAHLAIPRGLAEISSTQVAAALDQAGVKHGIDTARIELLEAGDLSSKLVLIARGTPAKPGRDASIEYMFAIGIAPAEWTTAAGPLSLIHEVSTGAELARRSPPQPGQAGVTVRGEPVTAKAPRDANLALGSGVELADGNPNTAVAAASGVARLDEHGRVSVATLQSVRDVTGNLESAGSVVIRGDVKRGFTVKAGGDIEVSGMVANARLIAAGSILVQGGIFADVSTPYLQAGRDVITHRAERAVIKAGRNVLIEETVDCDLDAGDSVVAAGSGSSGGSIRGGSAGALHEIEARTVGTPSASATKLRVGYDWLAREDPAAIESELATRERQLAAARTKLVEIEGDTGAGAKLNMVEQLLRQRVRALRQHLHSRRCITVRETLYPGTELTIDGVTTSFKAHGPAGRFVAQGGKIAHVP